MDDDADYQPGDRYRPRASGRLDNGCGCLAALAFALPAGFIVLLSIALGDCAIDVPCHGNDKMRLLVGVAIVLALAALFGLAMRTLARWTRLRRTDSAPGIWSLLWAIPAALALGLAAIWCVLGSLGLI